MFFLPNDKKIDMDMLEQAFLDQNLSNHYFLDLKNGMIENVLEMEDENADRKLENMEENRLLPIPQLETYEKYDWMVDFSCDIIGGKDKNLKEKLEIALDGKGAFRRFKDVLARESVDLRAFPSS